MSKEVEFTALACHACEATRPSNEVIWKVKAHKSRRTREIGFMLGEKIHRHFETGRVKESMSSSICPDCAMNGLGYSSLKELQASWQNNPTPVGLTPEEHSKWIQTTIKQYKTFKAQNPAHNPT